MCFLEVSSYSNDIHTPSPLLLEGERQSQGWSVVTAETERHKQVFKERVLQIYGGEKHI
jgi:hypothetical protein